MKKKQIINEIMGVPKVLTPWTSSIYEIIKDHVEEEISQGWAQSGSVTYLHPETNEEVTEEVNRSDKYNIKGEDLMNIIAGNNGFSDIKEFIKSNMFTDYPLWRPNLSFIITTIPDSVFNAEDNLIAASLNIEIGQNLSRLGKLMVLPNTQLHFDVMVPNSGINTKFRSDLKATITHELLHGYQKYKQLESGKPSHFGKETTLNAAANAPILRGVGLDWWDKFLNLVYLHLSFEINARIPQLYEQFNELGVNTKEEFLRRLKKSSVWKQMVLLESFNAEQFMSEFTLPKEIEIGFDDDPLTILHALMGGKKIDMVTNLDKLKQKGIDISNSEETIKSLIKLWDKLLQTGNTQIKNETGIDFNMLPVPQSAKEDPYLFFKFFEKRFHKKASSWKRKLYRIGSLLIQND
jgi:hypothetical protein